MKKITFLLTFFILTLGFSQNGGNTCATAVAINPGSFTNTTIAAGFSGAEQGSDQPLNAAWFSFTPATNGTIDVNSCGSGVDTRVYIGTGTCGSLNTIAENDDECGLSSEVTNVAVASGVTYYIEWDDRYDDTSFGWSLSFTPSNCAEPSNISSNILDTSASFNWDTPAFGVPIGYDWEIVPQGNALGDGVVASGSSVTTSANSGTVLTPSTQYDFYVRTDCDIDGTSGYSGPVSFTTPAGPPPVNDLCSGALTATQQTNIVDADSANEVASSVANATNTNDTSDCFGGGDPSDDVWFSFIALTADVTITIDAGFDCVITLFETSDNLCSTLSELDCADNNFDGSEEIEANNLNIGDTYYFRVYAYSDLPVVNPEFTYKLWSSTTLSVDNANELDTKFKYFPNPVKNTLQLNAQSNIQNVSIYNMLGQEVLRTAPNNVDSTLDMSALQTGAYFVKVTINDRTETVRVIKQ